MDFLTDLQIGGRGGDVEKAWKIMNSIYLRVIGGPDEGRYLNASERRKHVIGRSSSSDFAILDHRLSRRHFLIAKNSDGWWLTDLESTNGTKVNGRVVATIRLRDGDIILAGDTKFRATAAEPLDSWDDRDSSRYDASSKSRDSSLHTSLPVGT